MKISDWGDLLGGIALFIFAMYLLEDALKQLAGRQFKKFLQKQTSHKFRAIAGGTVVTALLQSSSVVMFMILSFVGAGIMSMRNAIAISLGANLGSTLSGWIVATLGFKVALDAVSYPLLILFLLIKILLPSNNNIKYLTHFLMGFALLFIGLEWMKESVTGLIGSIDVNQYAKLSPYLFIPIGLVVTVIIQSSSATMAITLTALYHQVIPFESAACTIIGSEIGTSLKTIMGAWDGPSDKKRVVFANIFFNVVSAVLATLLLTVLIFFIRTWLEIGDPLIGLVTFQTTINIMTIILFYPFIGKLAGWLEKKFENNNEGPITKYITSSTSNLTEEVLLVAEKEIVRLFNHAILLNSKILGLDTGKYKNDTWIQSVRKFTTEGNKPDEDYRKLKKLHGTILQFLIELHKENMNPVEIETIGKLIAISRHTMHAAKNIKDIQHNIIEVDSTSNDSLNEELLNIREKENEFYSGLQFIITDLYNTTTIVECDKMLLKNISAHQNNVDNTLLLLNKNEITELDSSTLLNVYREIYSSHKALLSAAKNLYELHVPEMNEG